MTVSLLAAPDPDAHFFADFFWGGGATANVVELSVKYSRHL